LPLRKPLEFKKRDAGLPRKKVKKMSKKAGLQRNVEFDTYLHKREIRRKSSESKGRRIYDEQPALMKRWGNALARFRNFKAKKKRKEKKGIYTSSLFSKSNSKSPFADIVPKKPNPVPESKWSLRKARVRDLKSKKVNLALKYPPRDLSNTNLRFNLNPHGPSISRYFLKSRLRKYIPSIHAKWKNVYN